MSEKNEEACGPAGDSTRAVMAYVKSLKVYRPGYYYRGGEVLRPAAVVVNDLSQPEPARRDGNGG
jgi:hypothetical protein